MKKIIIILVLLGVVGGGGYFFLQSQKSKAPAHKVEKHWNAYSTEDNHLVTLTDRMTAVAGGTHIAKLTVTLKLKDEHAYEKFEGLSKPLTEKEKKKAAKAGHAKEEGTVYPMNVKMNALIASFMIQLGSEEAKDLDYIQTSMKDYLNEHLELDKDFIEEVYVEQYVFN